MSKYIDEIIQDLSNNPKSFKDFEGQGVQKENIIITKYGNGSIFSIINVYINHKDMTTSYFDRYKLEISIKKWYRNISLEILKA